MCQQFRLDEIGYLEKLLGVGIEELFKKQGAESTLNMDEISPCGAPNLLEISSSMKLVKVFLSCDQ